MKKIFLLLVFGFLPLGGCAYNGVQVPGTRYRIVPPGVQLEVFHNCTSASAIAKPAGGEAWIVPAAKPTYVYAPFTGETAKVTFTVFAADEQTVIATITRSFSRSYHRGVRTIQWIIGGNAKGGGQDVVIDHVRGVC